MPSPNLSRLTLDSQLTHARETGDAAVEAALLIQLGDMARGEEEYDLAQGLYAQAWAAYERAGDAAGQSRAMRFIGDLLMNHDADPLLDDPVGVFQGESFLRHAIEIAQAGHAHEEEGHGLIRLSEVIGPEERRRLVEKALACFESVGNFEGQAGATSRLAQLESAKISTQNSERALQLYKRAVELYEHTGSSLAKADNLKWYGTQLIKREGYEQGYPYLKRALLMYQDIDPQMKTLWMLKHMANIALTARDYTEAKQRFQQAIPLCTLHPSEMRQILDQLGELARIGSDYAQSEKDLKQLIAFYEHPDHQFINSQNKRMRAFKDLAWINIELGRFEDAQMYNEKAYTLCEPHKDPTTYASILNQKALIEKQLTGIPGALRSLYKVIVKALPGSNDFF